MKMAKWSGTDRRFSPASGRHGWKWDSGLGPQELWDSFKSSSPFSLSDFDLWEKSLLKSQSSAGDLPGSNLRSKTSTSQCGIKHSDVAGLRRWRSVTCLAPEVSPAFHSSQGVELQAALEKSCTKRAELVKRLREAHTRLDIQTELLKTKETQLQHSQSTTQLLELKRKQLAKTLSALEQEKEAAELSSYEESQSRQALQDKVSQMELEMLKIKSNLESRSTAPTSVSQSHAQLSKTIPLTKDDFFREAQKNVEKDMKKLKEALREAEERAETLQSEKDCTLQQLHSSKEGQQKLLSQAEDLKQRLSTSMQAKNKLQDQLSESHSKTGQLELERGHLSAKVMQLEDGLEDLKAKLAAALVDKDRLVQEKVDLHQRAHSLELQLQRVQLGKEGFTEQVFELHSEITQAKCQASRHQQNTLLMKEELRSTKEVNDKLSADLAKATERLQVTLKQLHELEAEKLIFTNQTAALENERLQLIGEKEELMNTFDQGDQEKLKELREQYRQLNEMKDNLEHENQDLQANSQGLERKMQNMESECEVKMKELLLTTVKLEQEKEELKTVAAHWNERWLDVAMKLQSAETQLEETKREQQETDALREEVTNMASVVEKLGTELKDSKHTIQRLLEQKTQFETELARVKKEAGALERVELDACRQQLELEQSRSQALQQRMMGSPVSLEQMDGELVQVKAELQKVWDMLKSRDTELEEQQQELQCARGQVNQQTSEVQRVKQQLLEQDQELKERDVALKNLIIQKDRERTEAKIKITALEKELVGLKEQKTGQDLSSDPLNVKVITSLKAQLEESRRRTEQLKQERDQALQSLNSLKPPQQSKEERVSPSSTRKEKCVSFDLVDPNHQRRLITEQLKNLFKEREQLSDGASPVLQRKAGPGLNRGLKSKVEDESTLRRNGQDLGVQEGAGASAPKITHSVPAAHEKRQQEQPNTSLGQELSCNTSKPR